MLMAHKIKLFPTPEQAANFARCEAVARATYNQALRMWEENYQRYLSEVSALCWKHNINPLVNAPRCVRPRYKKRAELEHALVAAGVSKAEIPKPAGFAEISKLYKDRPAHWKAGISYWPGAGKIEDLKDAAEHFFRDGFGYPKPIKDEDGCGFVVLSAAGHCECSFRDHVNKPVWQRPLTFNVPQVGVVRMAEPLRFKRFKWQEKTSPRGKNKGKAIRTFPVAGVTISRSKSGAWFASILCSVEEKPPASPRKDYKVGVDLGVKTFAKLSDETPHADRFPARRALRRAEARLRRLERKMSRQQRQAKKRQKALRNCKNYQKSKRLHASAWKRVTDKRETYTHQVTTALVKDYPIIGIEDLRVRSMMRKGKPGNKPRKAKLNRAIGDAGFGRFRVQLEYKAKWCKREIHYAPQFEPTSKLCNACGHRNERLKLRDRVWTCAQCGAVHDRDLNAAINIREKSVPSDDLSVAGKDAKDSKSGSVGPRKRRSTPRKSVGETPSDSGAVGAEQSVASAPIGQNASANVEENAPGATGQCLNDADFPQSSGFKSRLDGH